MSFTAIPARGAFLLAVASILSVPAAAKTYIVSKGGAHPTIASGVALAGPGDTVLVKAGVYQENVEIPAGKDGLKLVASGKAIIEARAASGAGNGPGIRVNSAGVDVSGFTIQNAADDPSPPNYLGYGIQCLQDGLKAQDCAIYACSNRGIYASACDDVEILGCRLAGNFGGIYLKGSNAKVVGTTLSNDQKGKIDIIGSNARVAKCKVLVSGEGGIIVTGAAAVIEQNEVQECAERGITAMGPGEKVTGNDVRDTGMDGIYLSSATGSIVKDNSIRNAGGRGINSAGDDVALKDNEVRSASSYGIMTSGAGCTISGNQISDVQDYAINANGDAHVIEGNKVECVRGIGVCMSGDLFTIEKNKISGCFSGYEGIYVVGITTAGVIRDNAVSGCAASGILISSAASAGIVVAGNSLRNCCMSGAGAALRLSGGAHEVRNNVIKDSEGIENSAGATSTTVEKNVMKKNRIDLANSGTGTQSGNAFGSGGWSTPPEIE
ncbi:MAG: right-handed parallel beta-helix repeat-containing protein [Planctomycetes bacterium]|nr:right-handed parallel beta-helix repeat-containing protein [Planctomycetota bacterium]